MKNVKKVLRKIPVRRKLVSNKIHQVEINAVQKEIKEFVGIHKEIIGYLKELEYDS